MAITGQTGIWRKPCRVVFIERIYNFIFKLFFDVYQVERHIEHTSHTPCIINGFQRATFILNHALNAIILRLDHTGFRPETEHNANYLVSLFFEQRGSDRAIYATTHCNDYSCHNEQRIAHLFRCVKRHASQSPLATLSLSASGPSYLPKTPIWTQKMQPM